MSVKPRDLPDPSGQIDALIAAITDWRGETFARIRRIIREADPQIVEEFKWMGSPVWSRDGIIAVANAFKGRVNVTFANGASLPDPDKLFNAGFEGNARRVINFFENDAIDERALQNLVRAAIEYNHANLKKNQKKSPAARNKAPVAASKKAAIATSKEAPVAGPDKAPASTPKKAAAAATVKAAAATPKKAPAATPRTAPAATPKKAPATAPKKTSATAPKKTPAAVPTKAAAAARAPVTRKAAKK